MKQIRPLVLLCTAVIPCAAQVHFRVGAAIGASLTDTLNSSPSSIANGVTNSSSVYSSAAKRVLAGPVFRMEFFRGFGLEIDALYQRTGYNNSSDQFGPGSLRTHASETTTANRWQFPMMIQYSRHHVFGDGGLSVSHIGNSQSEVTVTSSTSIAGSGSGPTLTQTGIIVGGGVDLPVPHSHLRPEIRYTRWLTAQAAGTGAFTTSSGGSFATAGFNTNPNEISALLNWTF